MPIAAFSTGVGSPPHLLKAAALSPILIGSVAKAIDMVIKAEVNPNVHVEHLLTTIKKTILSKPALCNPHHPCNQRQLFEVDSHKAAVCCNIHQHSRTFHSERRGKTQCPLAISKETVKQTTSFQIKPCQPSVANHKGKK